MKTKGLKETPETQKVKHGLGRTKMYQIIKAKKYT
jgi:hypothetical protein